MPPKFQVAHDAAVSKDVVQMLLNIAEGLWTMVPCVLGAGSSVGGRLARAGLCCLPAQHVEDGV
jgi:hypothetical protein